MTTGRCRICHIDGPIEADAAHVYRCPDHTACAARAALIAHGEDTDPATLAPDDLERLQRKLASAWVARNMGRIGAVIVDHIS